MKKKPVSQSGIFAMRALFGITLCLAGVSLAMFSFAQGAPGKSRAPANTAAKADAMTPQASLAAIEKAQGAHMLTQVSRQTGKFAFVRAPQGGLLMAADASRTPAARALTFLSAHGGLVGMNAGERSALAAGRPPTTGSNLQIVRTDTDDIGLTHVRMDQFYQGLKVAGAQLIVHMNDRGITAVNGDYVPEVSLSTVPALDKKKAGEVAVAIARKGEGSVDFAVGKTELAIYPKGLLEDRPVTNHLAYSVEVSGGKKHEQVWVDAQSGALLNRISMSPTALYREIWSPDYRPDIPLQPFLQRKEGDPPHPTTFVNNLYDFAGQTYNLYASAFGRDSYDGAGHKMISVYLVNQQCPNAYWNSTSTNYCPIFDADDVVSHEWGHAYTEHTHGLIYSFQSGALNESYSDIFGETLDLLNGAEGSATGDNTKPFMQGGQRWLVGEDLGSEVQELLLRDMYDPDRLGDPSKVSSTNYFCGSDDGGGVHTNSGVPNHAYALVVDGTQFEATGSYNGQTVAGIGFTKAAAIYWRAESFYQTPTTNFPGHDLAIQTSCNDLIGANLKDISTTSATGVVSSQHITAANCGEVAKAMLAVEMSGPPPCPYPPVLSPAAPPICPGAGNAIIFQEDWEGPSADAGWTRTNNGFGTGAVPGNWDTNPVHDFKLTSTIPPGHTSQVIFADNARVGEPGGGTCANGGDYSGEYTISSPAILIPANNNRVQLSFDHYVATEGTVDGGQLEISTDGGNSYTLVPRNLFVFNPYNSAYDLPPPAGVNTGPNPGEDAWTGVNGGSLSGSWGTSVVDLSSLATPGTTIKIRFHWSQDGCNGADGWFIDNIRLYNCVDLLAPVLSVGAGYTNPDPDGAYSLNWTSTSATSYQLQESKGSCAPLFFDDASGGTAPNWDTTRDATGPTWQTGTKAPHAPNMAFLANPTLAEATTGSATMTMRNPIAIPYGGTTKLSFLEFYFNEADDRGYVEVSNDNGANWTVVYTNARDMGGLPDEGASAFATEALTKREVDLTSYKGQQIKVRFRFLVGELDYFLFVTYGWYVDDISIVNDNWSDVASTATLTAPVSGRGAGNYCYRVRAIYNLGTEVATGPFSNSVSTTVASGVTPFLSGVFSRKLHGGTPRDIPLPPSNVGAAGVECRNTGTNTHDVVFLFDQAAAVTSASVTPGQGGTAQMSGMSGNNTTAVTVSLSNVSNAQTVQVSLTDVSDGVTSQNFSVPMAVLNSDATANGMVNSTDISQAKSQSGQPVGLTNFRLDVNASGDIISSTDISQIKSNSGMHLP